MVGSLGDIVFTASHDLLRTFTSFQRSGTPRVAEHEVIGRKAVPEFQAPGVESVSFQMRFDAAFGVNPEDECTQLRALRDAGRIMPLAVGGKFLGDWYISGLSEAHTRHDGKGRVLVATVDIQLKEVAND
jgi:phage protein U